MSSAVAAIPDSVLKLLPDTIVDVSFDCLCVYYNWPIPARQQPGQCHAVATFHGTKMRVTNLMPTTYVLLQLHGKELPLLLQTDCSFYLAKWGPITTKVLLSRACPGVIDIYAWHIQEVLQGVLGVVGVTYLL